jgi:hypothetical protein
MFHCIVCNIEIPAERHEFLFETGRKITCLNCSAESKLEGFMDYNHKTAPQLVVLPQDPEIKRIAKRAFQRAR